MPWWENRKHILVREKAKIEEAFPDNNFNFEIRDNHLWITGTLLNFFEFECRYPKSYPTAIPDIFPKNRSSKWIPKHQYVKEGRFCLNIREKSWSSRLTAANIIKSLETLLVAEYVRLKEKIRQSKKLMLIEQELDLARRIQQSNIPIELPKIKGLDINAKYISMEKVGGDFYDFHLLEEDKLSVLVADVSGHGIPAALVSSMIKIASLE